MVFSDGFHTTVSPQTRARAVFHDQTATGKLKALITPTTPSGCHCSIIRWPGRSEAIVRPNSCRDWPTARSQMSIISCTSPRPSERILPASTDTSAPRSSLCSRSRLPNSRTSWPRTGPGTRRQAANASAARPTMAATWSGVCAAIRPSSPPVTGERAISVASGWPAPGGSSTPSRDNTSWVCARSVSWLSIAVLLQSSAPGQRAGEAVGRGLRPVPTSLCRPGPGPAPRARGRVPRPPP